MRYPSPARRATILLTLAVLASGCRRGGLPVFNLLGLDKPLVVGMVEDDPLQVINPFSPYDGLRRELGDAIGRSVAIDMCLPMQVAPYLAAGHYHLAIVSPTQYAALPNRAELPVIAAPVDAKGRVARSALLVTPAASEIQGVADLRGKVVAFGPANHARTHRAAMRLLADNGVALQDLSLELLPVPGSPRHLPDAAAVFEQVLRGAAVAGFVDQLAWEALPERSATGSTPARAAFRVVAQTVAVPDRLWLASPKLEADTLARVRAFLTGPRLHGAECLKPLSISGFDTPDADALKGCTALDPTSK
ncbi:MAG: phosphate/phosphite/phosphonate ABC transporter substrate-binding protein [Phycisphaerae bacterium]